MEQELDYYKVDLFWEWFQENESRIKEVFDNDDSRDREDIIRSLNNQVLQFGMFTWEIGYGTSSPYSFTISPNGDPELLEISREIIAQAPPLPDWDLHHARPPKDWDLSFSLFDEDMEEQDVDASGWRFVKIPAGQQVKLILEAPNSTHLDDETKKTAANLVVTSLMGEERKIDELSEIVVVEELPAQQRQQSAPIFHLLAEPE